MKTINNFFKTCAVILLMSFVTKEANAQTTKSKITAFMASNGWEPDTSSFSAKENDLADSKEFYSFSKDYKYTVFAFSENPKISRIKLNMKYINGDDFEKDYNTHIIQKLFNLPFECAVHIFSSEKDLTLSIETPIQKCLGICGKASDYMIFRRQE